MFLQATKDLIIERPAALGRYQTNTTRNLTTREDDCTLNNLPQLSLRSQLPSRKSHGPSSMRMQHLTLTLLDAAEDLQHTHAIDTWTSTHANTPRLDHKKSSSDKICSPHHRHHALPWLTPLATSHSEHFATWLPPRVPPVLDLVSSRQGPCSPLSPESHHAHTTTSKLAARSDLAWP